jgi:hypothetical protein
MAFPPSAPHKLVCFGGPACGREFAVTDLTEHMVVDATLYRYNPETGKTDRPIGLRSFYTAHLLAMGKGALFRSRWVLKYVPPAKEEEEE